MSNTLDYKYSRNTLIDLEGTKHPDKMVTVSGHIDSWDVGQGAMDNGGGLFISWHSPVILHQLGLRPRRSIRAILWTAEEVGLIGSAAYLKRHQNELDKIDFMLESDEATFKPLGLVVGGSNETRCIMAEILQLFKPVDKIKESKAPGSYIVAFIDRGVTGASLLNENEAYFFYHHTEVDTINMQKKKDVVDCAAFWAALSYVIADLSVDILPVENLPDTAINDSKRQLSLVYSFTFILLHLYKIIPNAKLIQTITKLSRK